MRLSPHMAPCSRLEIGVDGSYRSIRVVIMKSELGTGPLSLLLFIQLRTIRLCVLFVWDSRLHSPHARRKVLFMVLLHGEKPLTLPLRRRNDRRNMLNVQHIQQLEAAE
jgi:hypothetical protein